MLKRIQFKIHLIIMSVLTFGTVGFALAPASALAMPVPSQVMAQLDTKGDGNCPTNKSPAKGQGANCFIKYIIRPFLVFLTSVAAVFVIISIVIGGIQYSSAGGDPSKVSAARKRIYNAIVALLAFIFLWAFLQWIVPGGVTK